MVGAHCRDAACCVRQRSGLAKMPHFHVSEAFILGHSSGGRSMLRPYSEHWPILTHPHVTEEGTYAYSPKLLSELLNH